MLGFFDNFFEIDGRMTCTFTSFSTVFQSNQDGGVGVIHNEKLCAKESHLRLGFLAGTEPGPPDQQASA